MKRILSSLAACLCLCGHAAAFDDPLARPARPSALAAHAPVNGLAMAGRRIVAVGQRGHILYSDDAGRNWRQASVPVSVDLTAVSFATPQEGWAVGHDGAILHSADGGETWLLQADGRNGGSGKVDDRPLLDIRMADKLRGMAVGAFGLARCTGDGGRQWLACEDRLDNPQGLHLNAIRAIGDNLYIAGEQGLLLRSAGGAGRFSALALPYRGSLFGVVGDGPRLLAFGLRGNAWFSADSGATWEQSTTGLRSGLAAGLALPNGFVLVSQTGQLLFSESGRQFAPQPAPQPEPVTAALLGATGEMVTGGVRGVRVHVLQRR
ncbi:WD40/YVTN/BNR-like repeat-containing protein [Pseudoduganella sp. UC29_106]|uniref:WD40/YVTN/BNR-like repeat-containing protein n=1 Tax=Pseudoduganella sp. UC29_106 TaxID=3374553 RepID=UPI003756A482